MLNYYTSECNALQFQTKVLRTAFDDVKLIVHSLCLRNKRIDIYTYIMVSSADVTEHGIFAEHLPR